VDALIVITRIENAWSQTAPRGMLSIIIAWCNRDELGQTLTPLLACVDAINSEVVVVNFGGELQRLLRQVPQDDPRVILADAGSQRYFNKSKAYNLGSSVARGDILFFCDCDVIIERETLAELVATLVSRPNTFATLASVSETVINSRRAGNVVCFGYELTIRIANGRELHIVDNEEDAEKGTRQAPGLLLVRRSDLLSVGGYNGRLHGWGWEDQDIIARLTLGAGLQRITQGSAEHVSHDDSARLANYPVVDRWESRDRMFRQALANYDRGDFNGTYESDIAALPLILSCGASHK
jgi:glycosyltransferase involved in cell wall biosynthesis